MSLKISAQATATSCTCSGFTYLEALVAICFDFDKPPPIVKSNKTSPESVLNAVKATSWISCEAQWHAHPLIPILYFLGKLQNLSSFLLKYASTLFTSSLASKI